MCRVLAYLGQPLPLADVLFETDNSLVRQAHAPRMTTMLNLAGFGFAAWEPGSVRPTEPFLYRSPMLPVFDRNLRHLVRKLEPTCALAHVRGVQLAHPEALSDTNLHPFCIPGTSITFAHNGHLREFGRMRFALVAHILPDILSRIDGTSDSAWLYALLLSQLEDPFGLPALDELVHATVRTLEVVRDIRAQHGIDTSSPTNLFIATGDCVVATRFSYDYGWYPTADALLEVDLPFVSLWFTYGDAYGSAEGEWIMSGDGTPRSLLVASEPLTADASTWLQVPEYALLAATLAGDDLALELRDLDI
ncbi:MAG TPA: class II glutamine amidotransferase [Solirubrobacteraceae bacterium]